MTASASVDTEEIERFASHPQDWWNTQGVWSPLHKMNPARLKYIRTTVCNHFKRQYESKTPLKGISVLDIGCGGGLTSEPIVRWGAKVVGLDASEKAIGAAKEHAAQEKLKVEYLVATAEDYAKQKKQFDVILALEVLEHAADIGSLLKSTNALLKPNGILIASTVNRTTKSYLLGIVAAEYILGWVPSGMHDWHKFIRPSELAEHLARAGLELTDVTGIVYNILSDRFSPRQGHVDVNYIASALKSVAKK
jgi:2-polyprenyl-6-hydroxyphenyl methylase/3-demethylubiquinone-9 3-methyltransferase